jgi:hypothetical protein
LEALDGNPSDQERFLYGDLASIRAALKGKGGKAGIFEGMGDREFMTVVHTARVAIGRVAKAYRETS